MTSNTLLCRVLAAAGTACLAVVGFYALAPQAHGASPAWQHVPSARTVHVVR